jgi:nucleotide-binding universal stress UspA family protein
VPVQAYENSFLKGIKLKAHTHFEKLKERYAGKVKVHFSIEHGSVTEGIKRFVSKKRIDVVVMGTHGSSGLKEYTMGSNTEKIVRSLAAPVIAIKKVTTLSSLNNIIFPTNLQEVDKKVVSSIKVLQGFLKAKLHILYVNVPSHFVSDHITEVRLIEFAREHQFKNCDIHIYNDIDEQSGIMNFSNKFKNKIIAMSTHGRKGINHLLSGSVAEDVVNHIDAPIWTCSEK